MENLGTFMNLMTDFAFKRMFGTEERKSILIRFLNTLFIRDGIVVYEKIKYANVIILTMLMAVFPMTAETVSQKEASRMAEVFFNAANGQVMAKPKLVYNGKKLTTDRLFSPYYIYNLPKGGFVIISAENKAMPILGYSMKESFDPESMPGGILTLLQEYAKDIEYIRYDPRMPVDAIAAWTDYNGYVGDLLYARNDASEFSRYLDENGVLVMRKRATEFDNPGMTDPQYEDEAIEEEYEPFSLYEDFIAETRAEEARRMALFEERLLPTEPVVRSIGGGHFEIFLPEEVVMVRVYNLEGAQVETRTFKGTQTAEISLDAEPKGFYFAIVNGKSGKPYGIKLWK